MADSRRIYIFNLGLKELKWLKCYQVRRITTVFNSLISFAQRELRIVWTRYCTTSPCSGISFLFNVFFSFVVWYRHTRSGYSAGIHGLCGAGIPLNGIKHGGQLGTGLDLCEEFTEQWTFIWNKSDNIVWLRKTESRKSSDTRTSSHIQKFICQFCKCLLFCKLLFASWKRENPLKKKFPHKKSP